MAKINYQEVEKYASGTGGDFFSLVDDKDSAVVRFLYEKEDDLDIYAIHQIELDGGKRKIECLEPSGQECPLCKSGNVRNIKIFLQLEHDGKLKIWERGKTFIPKIIGLIGKYGYTRGDKGVPEFKGGLVNRQYEVERHGKKGDQKTTYEIYPLDYDGKTLEDSPEKQDILGALVLQKTAAEMEAIVSGGVVADTYDAAAAPAPTQRKAAPSGTDTF